MSERSDRRFRAAARRLGALAGVAASISLAGCPSTREEGDGDSSLGGGATAKPSGDRRADEHGASDCTEAKLAALEEEHRSLRWAIEDLEFEAELDLVPYRVMETHREQWTEGFDEEVIAAAEAVATEIRNAVCIVKQLEGGEVVGNGTGWFVAGDLVVTNSHNVHEFGEPLDLRVTTIDGTDIDDMSIVGFTEDETPDVAVLRTDSYEHDASLAAGSVASLETDQPLVQVGHPGGVGYWAVSVGRFVDTSTFAYEDDDGELVDYAELVTTIPGRPGVSGSPVVTLDGEVVGLTYAGSPVFERDPRTTAPVAPSRVYDFPLSPIMASNHVGVDSAMALLEDWR